MLYFDKDKVKVEMTMAEFKNLEAGCECKEKIIRDIRNAVKIFSQPGTEKLLIKVDRRKLEKILMDIVPEDCELDSYTQEDYIFIYNQE